MVSLALGRVYRALIGLDRAAQGSWSVFSVILMLVGVIAVFVALLPGSWITRALRPKSTGPSLAPIKMMGFFAATSYLVIVGLTLASHSWSPTPELVFSVCPACALTITADPSPQTVLLLLAPLSAAVYGALGGTLGCLFVVLQKHG